LVNFNKKYFKDVPAANQTANYSKKLRRVRLHNYSSEIRKSRMSIVTPETFSVAKLSISAPKTLDSGAKTAYLNYDGGKLLFQTAAEMTIPYGLSKFEQGPKADNPDFSIDLSFKGHEIDGSPVSMYHGALAKLDEFVMEEAYKNRASWFSGGATKSREVINAFYTPTIKVAIDKQGNPKPYPPTQKIKLRKMAGEFEVKIYDNDKKRITDPIDEVLVKGCTVTVIVECGGIWFAGGKFGVTWRAKQIMLHKSPERLADFAFVGVSGGSGAAPTNQINDDGEEALLRSFMPKASAKAEPVPKAEPIVAQSEPEEDADEEPEEVEIKPKPVTKKRLVVNKSK
jgi:hypothetical protein